MDLSFWPYEEREDQPGLRGPDRARKRCAVTGVDHGGGDRLKPGGPCQQFSVTRILIDKPDLREHHPETPYGEQLDIPLGEGACEGRRVTYLDLIKGAVLNVSRISSRFHFFKISPRCDSQHLHR
jgi:hypothetical protein